MLLLLLLVTILPVALCDPAAGSGKDRACWSFIGPCSCPAGYRAGVNSTRDGGACILCAPGTFRSFSFFGTENCTRCGANTECVSAGAAVPTACAPGWASAGGRERCAACPAGKYRGADDAKCLVCPVNMECAENGTLAPQACKRGWVSPGKKAACTQCERDTMATKEGSCAPCPDGTWNADPGGPCSCSRGHEPPRELLLLKKGVCVPCARGRYKSLADNSSCIPCAAGTTTSDTGAVLAEECATMAGHVVIKVRSFFDNALSALRSAVDYIFGSESEFNAVWRRWWTRGGGIDPDAKPNSNGVCQFNSAEALVKHVKRSTDFTEWRKLVQARQCKAAQKAARRLMCLYHPDKFRHSFPDCPADLSSEIAQFLGNEVDTDRATCAKNGNL
jgi:Tyrosine-protein kinase ephrin type A/B receptor-like